MKVTFVTGNPNKLAEAQQILGMDLASRKIDLPELQSMNLREIVEGKVRAAFAEVQGPVMVKDVSVEIAALGGLPGPFVKFWEKLVDYERALIVADHQKNHVMVVCCGVGYKDADRELYAESTVLGRLVSRRGEDGWGFDFYFLPDGKQETYAEMGREAKNQISHRSQAFRKMREMLGA